MSEMLIVHYDKKPFFVDNNTTRPDKTDGGIEKRIVNEIVANDRRWNFILECYAGFGISTHIFAKHAKKMVAVEKNLKYAGAMWANLAPPFILEETVQLTIANEDNLDYLRKALRENQDPPDLIDLDPFASCEEQLKLALRWMKDGALLLTNGHIKSISRDLSWVHDPKHYPDIGKRYVGNNAIDWPEEYFIPKLREKYPQLRVVHFYVHPTSLRLVCEVGNFKFQSDTIKKLKRSNYLDQFKDLKKDEGKNGKRSVKKS